jgi:hypothetical protein
VLPGRGLHARPGTLSHQSSLPEPSPPPARHPPGQTDRLKPRQDYRRNANRSTVASIDEHKQYRSAPVVKLFIALDYLESHGPDYEIPADDLSLLEPMLRSSNDDAASTLWVRDGWEEIVNRMIAKIGLADTAPPAQRGKWATPRSARPTW